MTGLALPPGTRRPPERFQAAATPATLPLARPPSNCVRASSQGSGGLAGAEAGQVDPFNGALEDVRVYNINLTTDQMITDATGGGTPAADPKPGRLQRRRQGGRQRPDNRADQFRSDHRHGLEPGDFQNDGKVDVNDLTIVLTNFGMTFSAGVKAVPEPSALAVLLAAGVVGLLAYAWRKRR